MNTELMEQLKQSDTHKIKFTATDIDGMMRGKIINMNKFLKGIRDDIGFCNVVFGWDINDVCYTNSDVSGWHTGYPDAFGSIDLNIKNLPWQNNIPFFLAHFSNAPEVSAACPHTLQEATNMIKSSKIAAEFFGKAFTDHFTCTREWEVAAATDRKHKRYFEIVQKT